MVRCRWMLGASVGAACAFVFFLGFSNQRCAAAEPPPKALKYHEALARKPSPGYLFDRFFNTWLDTGTVDTLEAFLLERAKSSGSSEDGLLLAFFWAKQGDDLKAIEQFRTTLAKDPGNAPAWFEKATLEARSLDFETALADLSKAAAAKPDPKLAVRVAKLQGQLLVRARRRDEAIKVWTQLLADHPDDQDLSEDVIELQIGEGLFDEAAALAQQLIERTKDPHRRVLRQLRLGDIRARAGKRAEGVATYRAALEQVGADSWLEKEILSQIERIYRKEDNVASLRREYESLVETYPQRVSIQRAYVRILAEQGDTDGAIKRFQELLKLTPGDRANQEAFIQLYIKADKLPDAITQLKALIEQHPQDPELQVQLATLSGTAGDKPAAATAIERFLAVGDKSEYAQLRAARLLEQLQLNDEAKRQYAATVAAFPESTTAREAQATFAYKTGDKAAALDLWRALGKSADVQQLVQLAKGLSGRQEHAAAYELLASREKDFATQPIFLAQLVTAATNLDKFAEALPHAMRRVEQADSSKELEDALAQTAPIVERAGALDATIAQLAAASPRSVQKSCLLAELYSLSGAADKADQLLAPLAAAGDLLAIAEQIRLATQRRDWTAAIAAAKRVLDLPGGRTSANVRRLVEYCERDYQIPEALKWVVEWRKLSPSSTSPWLMESRLQRMNGKPDEAIETLRQATVEFERNTEIRSQLAQLYVEVGKPADAERIYWQQYEESEELDGKLRSVERLAQIAEQRGKTDALVENFEQRRSTNRQAIEPLMALAQIYRVTNNYEGRRQALLEAAKLKQDDIALLQEIARIEEQEGDWERARATLERAAPLDRTNRTRQRLARLVLQYGNPEDGYAMLYALAGGDQSDPRELEMIADAMIGISDWQRARDFLARQIERFPADYRLRYLYGITQEENSEQPAAIDTFLDLLRADQEIANLPSSNSATSISVYQTLMRDLVPTETIELVELSQNAYQTYQYRNQRLMGVGMFMAGSSTRIPLPSTVEQMHKFALLHIISMAQQLDDAERDAVQTRLVAQGVNNADLLLKAVNASNVRQTSIVELAQAFPDRESVQAYTLLNLNGQVVTEAAFYQQAFARFAESRPQLALLAALGLARTDDGISPEIAAQTLKLLDGLQKPSPLVVVQLSAALAGGNGQQGELKLPDDLRQKLRARLIAAYPPLRNTQPYGPYLFSTVAAAVRQSGDAKAFVQLLDDELANWRSQGANKPARQATVNRRVNQTLLSPPEFPPTMLGDFPASVQQVLLNQNPFNSAVAENTWSPEEVANLLPSVKDPVLRVLLAADTKVDAVIDQAIKELLAAPTPTLDAYLLAAARAAEKEQTEEAIRLYDKARYLPMDRVMRRRVDASIVALVQLQAKNLDKESELLKLGRDAALRLRHGTLDPAERAQLVSALEDLGLKDEADQFAKQATSAVTSRSSAVTFTGNVARSQPDQIRKLVAERKHDVAAKILAQELTVFTDQYLANPANGRNLTYQWREVKRKIAGVDLTQDVLNTIKPKDTQNFRKIASYGLACEILGDTKEACKQYARVLEMKPKEDLYRVKILLLEEESDPAYQTEQLALLGKDGGISLGAELAVIMNEYEIAPEKKLRGVELVTRYLKSKNPSEPLAIDWVARLPQAVAGGLHSQRRSLPSLLEPASATARNQGVPDTVISRRAKVHEDLCREMLRWPDLAPAGFSQLAAAHEAAGTLDDEFAGLARDALLTVAHGRPQQNSGAGGQIYFNGGGGTRDVPLQTAAEFLVRDCWRRQDWTVLEQTVLPALANSRRRDLVDQFKQCREVYECPEADFAATAARIGRRNTTNNVNNQLLGTMPEAEWMTIRAWQDRKLAVDIRPTVLGFLKVRKTAAQSLSPPVYLSRFMQTLATTADRKEMADWYEKVGEIYLGPKARRVEYIAKNYSRRSISWNSPNGDIHCLITLLNENLQQEELLIPTLEFIDDNSLAPHIQNLENTVTQGFQQMAVSDIPKIFKLLERTGLLADPPEFRTYRFGNNKSLYATIAEKARTQRGAAKLLISRTLEARPQTVGTLLFLIELGNKKHLQTLVDHLGTLQPVIAQLPENRRTELVLLLRPYMESLPADAILSDGGRQALDWLHAGVERPSEKQVKKILAARQLEDVSADHGNMVEEWLAPIITDVAANDPDQAAQVYVKVAKLYDDAMQRHVVGMYYWNGMFADALPRIADRVKRDDPQTLKFLLALAASPQAKDSSLSTNSIHRLSESLDAEFRKLAEPQGRKAPKLNEFILAYHDRLHEILGERAPSILAWRFCQVFNERQPEELAAAGVLLEQRAAIGTDHGLALDMRAAAEFVRSAKLRKGNKKLAPKGEALERLADAPCYQHFANLLTDDAIPPAGRLALAHFLTESLGKTMPLPLGKAVAQAGEDAFRSGRRLENEQEDSLVENLLALRGESNWEEIAPSFAAAWKTRYLSSKSQVKQNQYPQPANRARSSEAVRGMVAVFLQLGDNEAAKQAVTAYADLVGHSPEVLGLLVRAGLGDVAATVLQGRRGILARASLDTTVVRYDEALVASLPKFYESLADADLRFAAEMALARLPDVEPTPAGVLPRAERMKSLADRFSTVTFHSDALQINVLLGFDSFDEACDRVAEPLAAVADKINLAQAVQADHDRFVETAALTAMRVRQSLRDGDVAPLKRFVDETCGAARDDWRLQNAVRNQSTQLAQVLTAQLGRLQSAQLADLLPSAKSLAERAAAQHMGNEATYTTFALLAHLHAGKVGDFSAWLGNISNGNRLKSIGIDPEIWQWCAAQLGPPTEENCSTRRAAAEALLKIAADADWLSLDDNLQLRVRGPRGGTGLQFDFSPLLTAAEAAEFGPSLVKHAAAHGVTAVATANALEAAGQFAAAADLWQQAAKAMPANARVPRSRAVLRRVEALHKAGQDDAARGALAPLMIGRVPDALKADFERIRDSLQPPAAGPSADSGANLRHPATWFVDYVPTIRV